MRKQRHKKVALLSQWENLNSIPVSEYTMVFSVRDQRRKTESAPSTTCEITHHRAFKQKPAGPSVDPDTAARRAAAEWEPAHHR